MGKAQMQTSCRDCRMCTGRAFTGAGRSAARRSADIATLGVTAVIRRKCRGCGHPMGEHVTAAPTLTYTPPAPAAQGPPPGWYSDVKDSRFVRWWDGQRWTEHVQPRA